MTASQVRQSYLEFFAKQQHKILPSSSLVPENDPTTLFTSSGMQPMVPYLLGESHPEGQRLTDSQKCFRSQDIEEVGDNRHQTFFEMLGNWSLGDYFKKQQLEWVFQFLTDEVGLDPNKLFVTAFIGDEKYQLPKDIEAANIWQELFASKGIDAKTVEIGSEANGAQIGMQGGRIFYYDAKKNWWSRAGIPDNMPEGEPGGPDSEIFYEFSQIEHAPKYGENCHPNCDCGRYMEIGNSVFMQYLKTPSGFQELPQKNVDFGGGLERINAASQDQPDVFQTDIFWPIIEKIQEKLQISYQDHKVNLRIIADHIKASTFLIKDGITPSNKLQGYVLRRLLRRAAVKINAIKEGSMEVLSTLIDPVIDIYDGTGYFEVGDWDHIRSIVEEEVNKFQKTLKQGLKEVAKLNEIDGKIAFDLYQTYGFPLELTEELFRDKGQTIDHDQFYNEFEKHRSLSQTSAKGMFKGGLQDHSDDTKKHHTATHLMNQALHQVLGDHIIQRGSYVSSDKLRFDFSHNQKLTETEIKQIENIVNQKITEDLPMQFIDLPKDEALASGALHAFNEKYADICRIYFIGHDLQTAWSKEFCGGPHVEHTGQLGKFKITKEESAGAGIRRLYATAI